jgi:hypothetical protein
MPRVVPPIEGKPSGDKITPSLVEVTAGFSAGVLTTLVVHPFDVLKTRLQRKCALDPDRCPVASGMMQVSDMLMVLCSPADPRPAPLGNLDSDSQEHCEG